MDLPDRRTQRLRTQDYGRGGAYFVTIDLQDRQELLAVAERDRIALNEAGRAVERTWGLLPERFTAVTVDAFVVMPDHVHGILLLSGAQHTQLGQVIGAFKSLTTVEYIRLVRAGTCPRFAGKFWQRNFFDRILRDGESLEKARAYIASNPVNWIKAHTLRPLFAAEHSRGAPRGRPLPRNQPPNPVPGTEPASRIHPNRR